MESNERKKRNMMVQKLNEPRAPSQHMSMEVMNVHHRNRQVHREYNSGSPARSSTMKK